ncbi:hypothetical protein [Bartonella sp. cb54]|uniref:hypothetical protein n=1 Tax=Bartonella sp. cb54 TaxID=3385560 RepID=UPI0039A51F66
MRRESGGILYHYGYIAFELVISFVAFLFILKTIGRGSLVKMTSLGLVSNFVMGNIIGGVIYNSYSVVICLIHLALLDCIF